MGSGGWRIHVYVLVRTFYEDHNAEVEEERLVIWMGRASDGLDGAGMPPSKEKHEGPATAKSSSPQLGPVRNRYIVRKGRGLGVWGFG